MMNESIASDTIDITGVVNGENNNVGFITVRSKCPSSIRDPMIGKKVVCENSSGIPVNNKFVHYQSIN